ncbi:trehalose-phosphatase [Marivita sp. S0852]|uniref:trehalose-phosphatase n=1 Tax=Marivita sp. S0852 TaxID=3373893 RepID=UPI003982C750
MQERTNLLQHIPAKRAAIFFDFDGTLVDIAAAPDKITVPPQLVGVLKRLHRATGGALAVITGRSIDDLTYHLPQSAEWIAGCHGGEWQTPGGVWHHRLTNSATVEHIQNDIQQLGAQYDGVVTEAKPLGAVVHYRAVPHLADILRDAVIKISDRHADFEWHPAKMAFELRPRDVGKDHVIKAWMRQAPFAGRTPVFFGDDLTDEPALAHVRSVGGISVKVGGGETSAARRVTSPAQVLNVLSGWLNAQGVKPTA